MPVKGGGGYLPVLAGAAFTGVGDIAAGARAFWGLRAYSAASIGGNAVKLRRDSDSATQTFATVAGGGLSLAAIASFKGAANLFVDTLYDQTGNGNDFVQTTAANQPSFTLGALGPLPAITAFTANSPGMATSTFALVANQALTIISFASIGASHGPFPVLIGQSIGIFMMGIAIGTGTGWNIYWAGAESTNSAALTTDTWYSFAGEMDGSSPDVPTVYLNSSQLGGSTSHVTSSVSGVLELSTNRYGNTVWTGTFTEAIWYDSALSGANLSSISSNQHSYWGVATTLDPVNASLNITLSGGNLIAAFNGTGNGEWVRSTTSHGTGKFYAEFTFTTYGANPDNAWGGACNASRSLSGGGVNNDANAVIYAMRDAAGGIYINGSVGTIGGLAIQGDNLAVAIDFTNQSIWYSLNGGSWNFSGTADPATNTGGVSLSTLAAGPYYFAIGGRTDPFVCVVNFGATAYAGLGPPAGFSNW